MIALPATPSQVLEQVINPELEYLPPMMRTNMGRVALLAIGIQESNLAHRQQVGGPARSFWQFERNGIFAVLDHPQVGSIASYACGRHAVLPVTEHVYEAFLTDDGLAAVFARCLLFADPHRLSTGEDDLWETYLRCWQPGKPDKARWSRAFKLAEEAAL